MSNIINIKRNLQVQFEKLYHHNRQGSYKTKARYQDAFKRFIVFLADTYHLERLANIAPKHIYAYTKHLVDRGLSISYIKTELSAIRFFHDQIPAAKNLLPSNDQLEIGQRRFGGVDRTWSAAELTRCIAKAWDLGKDEYVVILCLARYAGLRIHECFRIDTAAATVAINTGMITVKGKGGLVRSVPINQTIRIALQEQLAVTPRGQKLFVKPEDQTHLSIHRLENFICYYREGFAGCEAIEAPVERQRRTSGLRSKWSRDGDKLRDADSNRPMTFHGLRHTYAAEQYEHLLQAGCTAKEARLRVAKLLGHGRDSVTRIYLASLHD